MQEEIIRRGMLDQLLDLVTTDQQTDPDVTENTLQARFAQHYILINNPTFSSLNDAHYIQIKMMIFSPFKSIDGTVLKLDLI